MTPDKFFEGQDQSKKVFKAILDAINTIGESEIRVTKSQIAFRRRKAFAWVWMPGKYLHGRHAPLVLTLLFKNQDPSLRWKEIVEPKPGLFTHHLEVYDIADIDDEVCNWLINAWEAAE